MKVYVLWHDDRMYDMGTTEIRGVYRNERDAQSALVSLTPAGRPSKAWDTHNADCCSVEEWELEESPRLDIKEDDPPLTGDPLIPRDIVDQFINLNLQVNPYRRK